MEMCRAGVGVSVFGNFGHFRCRGLKCCYFDGFGRVFDGSAAILSLMSSQSVR